MAAAGFEAMPAPPGLASCIALPSNRPARAPGGAIQGTWPGSWRERSPQRLRDEFNETNKLNDKKAITMASERAQNLQDTFLNHVRKAKVPLTIFLVNGVKLQGIVTWFDNFCLLLRRDGHSQLVYKHAISTIMPGQPIQLFEGGEDGPA